ncbi:holin [Weissella phage PWc]|nr:holin [Weissella phage PWc]
MESKIMLDIINNPLVYLNPFTETVILFVMIAFDTILGGKWRSNLDLGLNSHGAFNGSNKKIALVFFPSLIGFLGIGLNLLPPELLGYVFVFPMAIFDAMALAVFSFAFYYTALSITANAQLAGMPVPEKLQSWAKNEIENKLNRTGLNKQENPNE